MGITFVTATVSGPAGTHETVEFFVDSGTKYTLLPEPVWKAIGLTPKRRLTFTLADGTRIERNVSEATH